MTTTMDKDFEAKAVYYKTARVTAWGKYSFVKLVGYDPETKCFLAHTVHGLNWFNWRELTDYCL